MKDKRELIKKGLLLVVLIILLNTDSLIIKEERYLIVFRGTYVLIFLFLMIYPIVKNKKEGLILRPFKLMIDHIKEFPRNLQIFIVVSIVVIYLTIIVLASVAYSIYW